MTELCYKNSQMFPITGMSWYKGKMYPRTEIEQMRNKDEVLLPSIDTPNIFGDDIRFIRLHKKGDALPDGKVAVGKEPQDSGYLDDVNFPWGAPEIQKWTEDGNNHGYFFRRNYIVVDADNEDTVAHIPPEYRETYSVKGNGTHFIFRCVDSPPVVKTMKNAPNGHTYGDVRGAGSRAQTVGAGSIHPSGKRYQIKTPLAEVLEVSWDMVVGWFEDLWIVKQVRKDYTPTDTGRNSLSDYLKVKITEVIDVPLKHNARGDEIYLENPMEPSSKGNLNMTINTRKNTWYCLDHKLGGDVWCWIFYAFCGGSEGNSPRTPEEMLLVEQWLSNNGWKAEILAYHREWAKRQPLPTWVDTVTTKEPLSVGKQRWLEKQKNKVK